METMNIALPESMKEHVRRRVAEGGYGSVSEYIRELIRLDQRRQAWAALESEVADGLASGAAARMTSTDWESLRKAVRERR